MEDTLRPLLLAVGQAVSTGLTLRAPVIAFAFLCRILHDVFGHSEHVLLEI